MSGPDALKRESAARREPAAAVEAATLLAGENFDPQPVPGIVGALLPSAIR